jgi:glycosyltransferase involved in cell wall biosynthesis
MRILYFSRDYTPHDHRFLSALAGTGHQLFYLRLERQGHQAEERALPPEVEILQWSGGNGQATLKDGPRLLLELKALIRRVQPDLIQAGPLQRAAFLVALAGFRPLVSMSWGYDLLIDARRNAWWERATRYTLQRSAALVGDCHTIRQLAVSYGMPAERIVTFPWGIDLGHFTPSVEAGTLTVAVAGIDDPGRPAVARIPHPGDSSGDGEQTSDARPFTLLSTRGWEPIYGVDIIARAFVQAARERPELRLLMLGNGSQASLLRRTLMPAIGNNDVSRSSEAPDRVLFPGQIGYADLPRLYRSADLYVSASHSDGTSISLLEAMACGCPVLVSDIPGNREWVQESGSQANGWLFPDGDAGALAHGILRAVEERQRLPEMGRAARRLAEQRADWRVNFPRLFEAYDIAMSKSFGKELDG